MKLEELEKIARAATQVKEQWGGEIVPSYGCLYVVGTMHEIEEPTELLKDTDCEKKAMADSVYISTFNPETVLKLLSKLKRYEEALKFYANENHFDHLSVLFYCDVDGIQREGGGFAVVDDGIIERGTVAKKALEDTK